MKKLSIFIIISVFVYFMTFIGDISLSLSIKQEKKEDKIIIQEKEENTNIEENIQETISGPMTMYTSYCNGCSGITASDYDVRDTIYYDDKEYGLVRIIAADNTIEFGTIIKIDSNEINTIAIVLDRGSDIGFNSYSYIDLLDNDHDKVSNFGIQNANFTILRHGFN